MKISESNETNNIIPSTSSFDDNGLISLLKILSQNNLSMNNLNFLENQQNELSRLINFINFLKEFNIELKDLTHVQTILSFFQNLSKMNTLNQPNSPSNNLQESNLQNLLKIISFRNKNQNISEEENQEIKNETSERPLNEHTEQEKVENTSPNHQKVSKNTNSMSTGSQEHKSDNTNQEKNLTEHYNINNFSNIIRIENRNFNENQYEGNSSEKNSKDKDCFNFDDYHKGNSKKFFFIFKKTSQLKLIKISLIILLFY